MPMQLMSSKYETVYLRSLVVTYTTAGSQALYEKQFRHYTGQFTFCLSMKPVKTAFKPRANQNSNYTLFLRPSTGRLCIDLEGFGSVLSLAPETEKLSPMSLLSSIDAKIIIESLTVKQYHDLCDTVLLGHHTSITFPVTTTIHLGAVYRTTGQHSACSPLAIAPTLDLGNCLNPAWRILVNGDWVDAHTTESGWNRFAVSDLVGYTGLYLHANLRGDRNSHLWLSQANHILVQGSLGVVSDDDNYGELTISLLKEIGFGVQLYPQSARPTDCHSSDGFLFLCPPRSFQIGSASFKCPECVGYWSLDPSGLDQLSSEQATELGFSAIYFSMTGYGKVWSNAVYAGLRQFHQGKGFDPDSQELARYLGVPLYQLHFDYEKSLNADGGEAGIEELSSSDTDQLVDEEEPENLGIVEDEKCESVSHWQTRNLDEETMDVSSSLELLSQIQLGLILLLAILGVCGSL
ncbi:hypothetical protein R3P38DRAFT_3539530 [Favolaschia claudopus]|uniref:Uncharacterized protein n=1 Tax=Favolaschia claudopus TaxID=2862362 RepID=A0AAW0B8M5_9AGAR